jgi:spermidine synthase
MTEKRILVVVAGTTMTLSGFLLFQVQPMMARYILPWFGGSATTWTVCLLFFQIALLLGYAYAYLFTKPLGLRAQIVVHVCIVAASLASLPITPSEAFKPQDASDPTGRILMLLLASVGLPYFVLATTTPLVQRWLAALGYETPSRLFALSNLGSFLGLVTYPAVVDLYLPTNGQTWWWSASYVAYAIMIAGFATLTFFMWNRAGKLDFIPATATQPPATWKAASIWFLLSMLGSASLLAVTNYITSYVAVNPFLWILPLSIYLLSFVVAFGRPGFYRPALIGVFYAIALAYNFFTATDYGIDSAFGVIAINLVCFLFCCLLCQGELARRQPPPAALTFFYMTLAAGGAMGGVFVSVLSPLIFPDYWELPIALIGVGVLFVFLYPPRGERWLRLASAAMCLGILLATGFVILSEVFEGDEVIDRRRNFYGVIQVEEVDDDDANGVRYVMKQAGERQGEQFQAAERRDLAPCDFDQDSGIGRTIAFLQRRNPAGLRIGVVGLGVGMLLSQGRAEDSYRYYELNPQVPKLANEDFSFIKDTKSTVSLVLGDGRLSLERELKADGAHNFDLLHIDAFRGNAPPAHLMTKEAFELYFKHLKPDGVLAVTSHRDYYDASSLFRGMADVVGAQVRWFPAAKSCYTGVGFAIFSRSQELFDDPRVRARAGPWDDHDTSKTVWTDQKSSLMSLLIWSQ